MLEEGGRGCQPHSANGKPFLSTVGGDEGGLPTVFLCNVLLEESFHDVNDGEDLSAVHI